MASSRVSGIFANLLTVSVLLLLIESAVAKPGVLRAGRAAFSKNHYVVWFEVTMTKAKAITKCEISRVEDPNQGSKTVKVAVSEKYKRAACKIISENVLDPRIVTSDPYYTYLMLDPSHPDIVSSR